MYTVCAVCKTISTVAKGGKWCWKNLQIAYFFKMYNLLSKQYKKKKSLYLQHHYGLLTLPTLVSLTWWFEKEQKAWGHNGVDTQRCWPPGFSANLIMSNPKYKESKSYHPLLTVCGKNNVWSLHCGMTCSVSHSHPSLWQPTIIAEKPTANIETQDASCNIFRVENDWTIRWLTIEILVG